MLLLLSSVAVAIAVANASADPNSSVCTSPTSSGRFSSLRLFGTLAAPAAMLLLGVAISCLFTRTGHGEYYTPNAKRFYHNPLAYDMRVLVNTAMLGPIFCHSDRNHPKHAAVYWEVRRKDVPLSLPGPPDANGNLQPLARRSELHRYCESRYRKLRLCLTLVSHFANRLNEVHPHDFEEVEVELEAMYSAVWSNIARAWYREPLHWEYFIQKVYGRFYLSSEFNFWSERLKEYVDERCSPGNQLLLFFDRMFLPLGLTAVALIGVLSFLLDGSSEAFGVYIASLALVSGALGLQGFLVHHSFHRRSNRYRGVLYFWTRRLIRLAYAVSAVLDDYYELVEHHQRNAADKQLRPWDPQYVDTNIFLPPTDAELSLAAAEEQDVEIRRGHKSTQYSMLAIVQP